MASGPRSDVTPEHKAGRLRRGLLGERCLRAVGVYDGFTTLAAERHDFDALWVSGLCVSAAHGVPDASILGMAEFLAAASIVNRVSRLPVIADCDSGFGDVNNVVHLVREYERHGIAAVCIEDKAFPKRNSFAGDQRLADPHEFAAKVLAAKRAQRSEEFLVFARLESLVAGAGVDDALTRARLYAEAGADALVVHSKAAHPGEVLAFAQRFRAEAPSRPLAVIPTTYPTVAPGELARAGISMVIFANQVLRANLSAADEVLAEITRTGSSAGVEDRIAGVEEILTLLGTDQVRATDAWFDETVAASRRLDVRT